VTSFPHRGINARSSPMLGHGLRAWITRWQSAQTHGRSETDRLAFGLRQGLGVVAFDASLGALAVDDPEARASGLAGKAARPPKRLLLPHCEDLAVALSTPVQGGQEA
jgi:hypothetical protein